MSEPEYRWAEGYNLTNDPWFWGLVYTVILILATMFL